jgi:RimJ/RimL family protein N-acetyltransferase
MTFEKTINADLIRSIVTHPQIYPHVSQDGAPTAEEWEPTFGCEFYIAVVDDDGGCLGIFILVPTNSATVAIHTCLLPHAWGEKAHEASLGIQQWVWENTEFVRLITDVPAYNRLALRFAKRAGLVEFGVNPKSCRKHGKLWDQVMLGVSRGETCQ